jgi:hypothetical protein
VVLDNINSAPPEVMERLNSLTEDHPTFNLYEHSKGETLSRAAGTIHRSFRLFATSNTRRPQSHKLSSAFLNRVLKITLAPMDYGLRSKNAASHPLLSVVQRSFANVSGGAELALCCTCFHSEAKALAASGDVKPMSGYDINARCLLRAAGYASSLLRSSSIPAPQAAAAALVNNYVVGVSDREQQAHLLGVLAEELCSSAMMKRHYPRLQLLDSALELWQTELVALSGKMADFELQLAQAVLSLAARSSRDAAVAAGFCRQASTSIGHAL